MSIKDKIKGPVFSIITPFKNNGKDIDFDSLDNYLQYLYDNGAKIFYAMAFNTRYLLMNEEEIYQVNERVIKKIKSFQDPDTLIIVGDPLDCSTETSIKFAEHAKIHGADMISLIYRAYLFYDDHVFNHYNTIAQAVDIPILVHEMPFMKGIPEHQDGNWSIDLLDRLADIPNVLAVKEDAKVDDYTKDIVDKISDRVAIVVSGNGLQQWSKVSEKCQAWLSGIGNLFPKAEIDFYNAYLENDTDKCIEIIEQIEKPFFYVKDNYSWHLGIKSAMEHLGIMSKQERMPYQELEGKVHQHIGEIVKDIVKYIN